MFLEDCEIVENKKIAEDKYILKIKSKEAFKHIKAGQFFMLKSSTYLRRPISVHYVSNDMVEFYYQVKGEGTKYLSTLKEKVNIQGPLGNGFDTNINNKKVLIAAGGMGIAPIKLLIEKLSNNNDITLVMGAVNKDALNIMERFDTNNIKLHIVTDDGSVGDKCNAVEKTNEIIKKEKFDIIYTCGPTIMMNGIIKIALANNILCYASLERRMACGVNACLGCNVEVSYDNKTVVLKKACSDGPVFDAKYLWIKNEQ